MKIAFVGKGGSGKSTMTTLFIRALQQKGDRDILALDADLNMNLAGLLGVAFPMDKLLSSPANAESLRDYLRGDNSLIADAHKFLPTTPPGPGSNVIRSARAEALAPFAVQADNITLLTVGTYEREGIGQSCYHTNLFAAENLLSHTLTNDGFTMVADMVAGTDAFAYSLHLQFDAIVLIAEPTPESVEVCSLYFGLAQEAGVEGLVHLLANKVEDEDDIAFITARTGRAPLAAIPALSSLKKMRQRGAAFTADMLTPAMAEAAQKVEDAARTPSLSAAQRFERLYKLHEKLAQQDWVRSGYGDIANQYDFAYLKEAM
jgi:CO dehydrogenase maturation factor